MSWVRTAAALIGFGLTLFQFMECLNAMPGIARAAHPEAPRYLGLALIGAGIIGAVIACGSSGGSSADLWTPTF